MAFKKMHNAKVISVQSNVFPQQHGCIANKSDEMLCTLSSHKKTSVTWHSDVFIRSRKQRCKVLNSAKEEERSLHLYKTDMASL